MTAFPWTDEQKAVLGAKDRITLVQAGPGSGKTKVFAEIVDRRVRGWTDRIGGLAALSFTNVARDEIADRISTVTVAPHFVGTLDAFFLRFVIGPFGHLAGLPKSGARLIPSPLDEQLDAPEIAVAEKIRPTILQITATGGTETVPEFHYRLPNGRSAGRVPDEVKDWTLKEKRKLWQSRGFVTHGDCTYLASCVLRGPNGPKVRAILARRFPAICVDEFQDTGHFLGRAVLALLAEPKLQALVVGDVDQKIFGFSGVNPNLFAQVEKIPGARKYPLQISQRCSAPVCKVASSLSRSAISVLPAADALPGRALLAKHKDKPASVDFALLAKVFAVASGASCSTVAILVRKRITKASVLRMTATNTPSMKCRGAQRLCDALDGLVEGRGRRAVDIAHALVCRILLGNDRPTDDELHAAGIEPSELRRSVKRLLVEVAPAVPDETWGQWTARAKALCDKVAAGFKITSHKSRLGGSFRADKEDAPNELRTTATKPVMVWPSSVAVEVLTVHEAKGREFDAVILYCPRPRKQGGLSNCPSAAWWAPAETSEEREVAFVAATRAKRLLVLAVHEATWKELGTSQKPFFELFESMPDVAPAAV